jgi:hypothetical protein
MSSVNYSLKHKGVRLIPSEKAWVKGKNGKPKLNPKYHFVGKVDTKIPNLIISATDNKKPSYKGSTHDLCAPAKKQIVNHFFDDKGKPNRRTKPYFGIEKQTTSKRGKK